MSEGTCDALMVLGAYKFHDEHEGEDDLHRAAQEHARWGYGLHKTLPAYQQPM